MRTPFPSNGEKEKRTRSKQLGQGEKEKKAYLYSSDVCGLDGACQRDCTFFLARERGPTITNGKKILPWLLLQLAAKTNTTYKYERPCAAGTLREPRHISLKKKLAND